MPNTSPKTLRKIGTNNSSTNREIHSFVCIHKLSRHDLDSMKRNLEMLNPPTTNYDGFLLSVACTHQTAPNHVLLCPFLTSFYPDFSN
jgi:hypothetical protein